MPSKYISSDESVNNNFEKSSGLSFKRSSQAKKPFTIVDRSFMQLSGKDLSDISFRIICYLMSLPEDWEVRMSQLRDHLDVGKEKLQQSMRELVDKGYIRRSKDKREDGTFSGWSTEYSDTPIFLEANKETTECRKNRLSENPDVGKNRPYIINSINIKNNNNTPEGNLEEKQSVVVSFDDLDLKLINELVSVGVKEPMAKSLVKQFPQPGYISSKIEIMRQGKAIGDRAAWLVAAIKENYTSTKIEASAVCVKSETADQYEDRIRLEKLKEQNEHESQHKLAVEKHGLEHLSRADQDKWLHEHGLSQIKAAKEILAAKKDNQEAMARTLPNAGEVRVKQLSIEQRKLIADQQKMKMKLEQETPKTFYNSFDSDLLLAGAS